MEIFANHAHVFPRTIKEQGTPDALLRQMDACGIGRAVCFAPFYEYAAVGELQSVTWLRGAIAGEDRLEGFGVLDFRRDDLEEQVSAVEDAGFRGIKLHPAFQRFALMDDKARRVYAACERAGLFLCFHTGVHWHRIADYHVLLFDEIAWHYPRLRFSMEHVGGYSFFPDALAVMVNNGRDKTATRVYGGLTSISDHEKNCYWYLSDELLHDAFLQAGTGAFLFGLDFPFNDTARTLADIERIQTLSISAKDKEKILGGNFAALLRG